MDKKLGTIVMDLDGTLCSQEKTGTYHQAEPKPDVIRKLNSLWTEGYRIIIFTARGMSTCNGDVSLIEDNYREMTEKWLKDNRVCYDELRFGKEDALYFVDDKGLTPEEFVELPIVYETPCHKDVGNARPAKTVRSEVETISIADIKDEIYALSCGDPKHPRLEMLRHLLEMAEASVVEDK